jgi:hypothetical protein
VKFIAFGEDDMGPNTDMVDKVNWELRLARVVATLLGHADLHECTEKTLQEILGDAATVLETHIDIARQTVLQWCEARQREGVGQPHGART